jgi:hypothetical protein
MATFTKGPWRIGKKFPNNRLFPKQKDVTPIYWDTPVCETCGQSRGERLVAHVFDGALPGQKKTATAVAALIAAAPELYDALQDLYDDSSNWNGPDTPALQQARVALAKARGEP